MNPITKRLMAAGLSSVLAVTAVTQIIPLEGEVKNSQGDHVAYKDMIGVPTACWGLTGKDMYGKPIKAGTVYSQEDCEKSLADELTRYNASVHKAVKVEMSPYEEIAYTSFIWNIGETGFRNSTLVKKLNSGDRDGACKELLKWNKVTVSPETASSYIRRGETCTRLQSGQYSCTVKGLTTRRQAEYKICTGNDKTVNDALSELEKPQNVPQAVFVEDTSQPINQEKSNAIEIPSEDMAPIRKPECIFSIGKLCFHKP